MPAANVTQVLDAYGHSPVATGVALTAGAVSTTAAGTIAGTTAAGAAPTVTAVSAVDMYGTFTLNPVTGGGGQAAGAVAVVTFANSLPAVPRAVIVTGYDSANAAAIAFAATTVLASSFQISAGVALTTAHSYVISYEVLL